MLRISVIQRETNGVTERMQSPAITASRIATLRTGSRAANQKSRLSMSAKPPVSLRRNRNKVETSPSGGRRKIRATTGLPAKIMSRLPKATKNENTRRTLRRARYGGLGMGRTSFHRGDYTQKRIRLNPSPTRSKIPPIHFFRREGPYAQLRFLLPRLQEKLLEGADACPI